MRGVIAACAALALAAGVGPELARAEPDDRAAPDPAARAAATRDLLARQLADEAASIDRALATVTDKLADADAIRARRLAAASRVLRAAPSTDPLAAARSRAAARWLLARDAAERLLLADEAARLRGARDRTAHDVARIPTLAIPGALARPARGKLVRPFGTLRHDRSGATLARRGAEYEVELHADVHAPADGVVRYAGPIRGLDHGVILDHGGFLTVLGKLDAPTVVAGATVRRGAPLARAARARVYLEVRVKLGAGGRPIDPAPLLEGPANR